MDRRLMEELVTTLRSAPSENLAALLRQHSHQAGHCATCHTVWPCTLWSAATAATHPVVPTPA